MPPLLRKGDIEAVVSELTHQDHGNGCECEVFTKSVEANADEVAKMFADITCKANLGLMAVLNGEGMTLAFTTLLLAGVKIGRRQMMEEIGDPLRDHV